MKSARIILLLIATIAVSCILYLQLTQKAQNAKNMHQYINNNKIIFDNHSDETIEVAINPPTELDYLSKEDVYNIRKQHVAMLPEVFDQNYTPSETVYGQIIEGKPWWGLDGLFCYGNSEKSIDGVSEESCFINNPLVLVAFLPAYAYNPNPFTCKTSCNTPTSLYFKPLYKTIIATQNLEKFYQENIISNGLPRKMISKFDFKCDNARDFGYEYIFANDIENIKFISNQNASNTVYNIKNFIHLGGSCGYPGGCNNGSPYQKELGFEIESLPAQINFKLWKQKPESKNSPADINYQIIFR